jgi:hypothetical protein
MGDAVDGARHNGVPFINAQPRFGIYRDWRAATQTIYFDRIMVWNSDPGGSRRMGRRAAGVAAGATRTCEDRTAATHNGKDRNAAQFQDTGGRCCPEYQRMADIGGVPQQVYGTACMMSDGSW